ncbi:MAG TPA: Hsp70 family protein [Kofleriaceae bacterium]|nr:Hsp70 family protein [Kofleriaceae bacterium]
MSARFLLGIDLGTTNSAVSYVDTQAADARVRVFEVPQLISPGSTAERRQLPSFVYLATDIDLAEHETATPWPQTKLPVAANSSASAVRLVVGELARNQGARLASRMVASAKSWLCHAGVDRAAAILPWGEADGAKLSPIAAQAAVLRHIREAWDFAHRGDVGAGFVEQSITVTVPASFDEAARELTLKAAAAAGYPEIGLLEEPQAAFYSWIGGRVGGANAAALAPGDQVLVFDVGGGTTDFTLITVDETGDGFIRTAVGDHVLLGGDNIDLTLAKIVEARVVERSGKKLDTLQWHGLVHACRLAKEQLLSEQPPDAAPIVVAGRGSKLIGGTLRDEVTRAELLAVLLDGFFPKVTADATLARGRGGLVEFGLPYAADAAITRHLAVFLQRHEAFGDGRKITAVLFNGGAMTPVVLRDRVLDLLAAWQGARPSELPVAMPELAVADGAAYFGLVRRGLAARIKGGTPRGFYIGVEGNSAERFAVCVAGKGLEEGSRVALARDFELVTNRPVSFRLYSSSSRDDAPGAMVPIGDGRADTIDDGSDLLELPPIVTVLRASAGASATGRSKGKATVRIEVQISELGALEIHCVEVTTDTDPGRWKLTFDMRSGGSGNASTGQSADAATDAATPHPNTEQAKAAITAAFRGSANDLTALGRELETLLEARRDEWSTATIRALFDALVDVVDQRKRTAEHESRWLHFAGFCMRPGFGAPLDAWRAKVMWGVFNENICFPKSEPNRLAWWIVWRRVGGGLIKGQQEQIFDRVAPLLLPNAKQAKKLAEVKASKQEMAEMWRVVGSLERLPQGHKSRVGDELIRRMDSRKGREDAVHLWALSRVGARVPLYGPLNSVVSMNRVRDWLDAMPAWDWPEPEKVAFALAQLGRRTGDRSRDLDDATRARLAAMVKQLPGGARAAVLIEEVVPLDAREELVALGDTLPAGLRMVPDAGNADEALS